VRVIAGTAKGRRLGPVPRGVRPVADRVREGVFSSLGDAVVDANVLDLFAGTGALGIEALSRGAREATFVERDRAAVAAIEANVRTTGFADRATIVRDEALRFVMNDGNRAAGWDLVLADPPYEHDVGEVEAVLRALAEGALEEGWTCVLTRATRNLKIVIPVHWRAYRRLEYGDSAVLIARQEPVEA
jgi:16S rRNA (guanine966-N2)-methyltransferase